MKSPLKVTLLLSLFFSLSSASLAQVPCENGMAGDYPCNQITLYSRVTPEELLAIEYDGFYANDIWGWTDPETNHEYALVGLTDGVAFVDITDPLAPRMLGKLRESLTSAGRLSGVQHGKSAWRDIKVYQNHAFVVSDLNAAHGMQVFDLTRLRELTGENPGILTEDALYEGMGSAHNIVINEATGYAYIVGVSSGAAECGGGGLHILTLQDPKNPEFVACFDEDGYTHDGQCVIYGGPDSRYSGRELCFNANEDTFTIVDVEDKDEMSMISRNTYPQTAYSHQGWLSEDHRFFLMNDELDENAHGFNPRTLIWDVEDLENPELIGEYFNEALAIDHNLYVHNGLVYESNYLSGLRVLDLAQVENGKMREVAFFDTYPDANGIHFGGTWSNYPFFESGTIAVTDMTGGLFLLKLNRQTDPITSHGEDFSICEGASTTVAPEISADNLTYQWQMLMGGRFVDAPENSIYSGTQSAALEVTGDMAIDQKHLRCKVIDEAGNLYYTFPIIVDVISLAVPAFEFEVETGGMLTLVNTSENADSYVWDFGDGTTSTEENPIHTYEETATYTIALTASNSCGDVSYSMETYVITSLNEGLVFRFYPNPTKERIVLQSEQAGVLEIIDVTGKELYQDQISQGRQEIQLPELPAGIYYLSINNQKGKKTARLIIQ